MPNYQDGKIYTIRCRNDDSLIYVGSTTQMLCKRFQSHKCNKTNLNKYYKIKSHLILINNLKKIKQ